MQLDKIALARWVDQALKQSFRKQKIKSRFRNTCIWPLNPKAMDSKTKTLEVYTATHMSNAMSEEDYTIKEEVENNPQWGKNYCYKNSPYSQNRSTSKI